MPRTKGSKNKNTATAKNKNIININVNSSKSKKGRPRKTTANTNTQARYPNYGGNANAPPQVIISQPQADNSNINNSLLSSFMTSKILNETMNRSNMTAVEPSRANMTAVEPPRVESSYFNARESIIPKLPDTPIKQEVKPPTTNGPPQPPPPPPPPIAAPKKKESTQGLNLTGLSGRDAMLAELKYAQTEEGKAERARKKAEAEAKKESKKMEKEVSPQKQSTTDFLNLSFTPPKKDIVEMMTPSKDTTSTAITPYKGNKSLLDFVVGGTPKKQTREEIEKQKLIELQKKKKLSAKEAFELNSLKSLFTARPNPNPEIAGSMITKVIKNKIARKQFKEAQETYDPAKHQEK